MNLASRALVRFGFRQTIRSALILGVLVGLIMGAQGVVYAKAFPDAASRAKLVASLNSVPAVDFLSGEVKNAATPASYAIYKSLAMMVIITGVWGLLVTTRLLRGFEEDGRTELLDAGTLTKRRVSGELFLGFLGSFLAACALAFVLIAALGASKNVQLSASGAAYTTLAMFLPGLFFAALGVLTSQLAQTRGRAVMYGLVPLLALFVIRGSANADASANWLKRFSPFGWSDLLNPVLGAHPQWIVPTCIFVIMFAGLGLYLVGRRDLGESIVGQSLVARSRFFWLKSSLSFTVRQNLWGSIRWLVGVVGFAAFFAALANVATNLVQDSSALQKVLANHSSLNDEKIKLAFLGVGTLYVVTALLVMIVLQLGAIRGDEAKGYLDNLLVAPIRRKAWLAGRLLVVVGMFFAIALVAGLTTWLVAHINHINVGLWSTLQGTIGLSGPLMLTLGIGVFFYGLWPRLAVAAASVFIGWAFVVDILKQLFNLNAWVEKTSFLQYVPSNPSQTPNWANISWLVVIGVVLLLLGSWRFGVRDITAE